ncbi:MAG TPA: phosphatidylglycerophosphatase A [Terriglobales bacterium]|nr:phosphatidylglycerophosphatase A [Terriglobales bacterium]
MNPSTEATQKKPRLALAVATSLGVGYIPKAPGTFGSLVGVVTAFVSAIFFLHPATYRELFSLHPTADAMMRELTFLKPTETLHDSTAIWPLLCAVLLLAFLVAVGVWSAGSAATYSGLTDPQFVVIDEVAGQHLSLILPLIPLAVPHPGAHSDISYYAIFFALSLVNWKYLLAGFLLFRLFDIWKPFPIRRLELLRGGWGIMADDWLAGIYAAICLRVALHFGIL